MHDGSSPPKKHGKLPPLGGTPVSGAGAGGAAPLPPAPLPPAPLPLVFPSPTPQQAAPSPPPAHGREELECFKSPLSSGRSSASIESMADGGGELESQRRAPAPAPPEASHRRAPPEGDAEPAEAADGAPAAAEPAAAAVEADAPPEVVDAPPAAEAPSAAQGAPADAPPEDGDAATGAADDAAGGDAAAGASAEAPAVLPTLPPLDDSPAAGDGRGDAAANAVAEEVPAAEAPPGEEPPAAAALPPLAAALPDAGGCAGGDAAGGASAEAVGQEQEEPAMGETPGSEHTSEDSSTVHTPRGEVRDAAPPREGSQSSLPETERTSAFSPSADSVSNGALSPQGAFGGSMPNEIREAAASPARKGDAELLPGEVPADTQKHFWGGRGIPDLELRPSQRVRVFCGVWNLHGKRAPSDLAPWLETTPTHHIYVIGTCECERSIEKSMIWSDKSRFEGQVLNHLGGEFRLVASRNMSAIHVMVVAHRSVLSFIWNVDSAQVATGIGNFIGNKGGVQVGFCVGRTSVLFVNAHLAAHQSKMGERTKDHARILEESPLRKDKSSTGVHNEYDRVFFMGDLNARVNAQRDEVDEWLTTGKLGECLQRDQLLCLLRAEGARAVAECGLWPDFEEAEIKFRPTYKFDSRSNVYDSSKKKRVPSWTDRILWKRDAKIRCMSYGSVASLTCSDHKPVFAQFEVEVDLTDWQGPEDLAGDKKSSV